MAGGAKLRNSDTAELKKWIEGMGEEVAETEDIYSVYAGTEEAVKAFYARAICRRAERAVIRWRRSAKVSPEIKNI